jgi:hypothetical protein
MKSCSKLLAFGLLIKRTALRRYHIHVALHGAAHHCCGPVVLRQISRWFFVRPLRVSPGFRLDQLLFSTA